MTYLANIENQEETVVLGILQPTFRLLSLTAIPSVGTNVYYQDISVNFVTDVYFNSTQFTAHTSTADFSTPTAHRYFYDKNAGRLYLDMTTHTSFTVDDIIRAETEFHVASKEVVFYRDPENSGTEQTIYGPFLAENFNVNRSVENNVDGFMPAISSGISLLNQNYEISRLSNESTLSKKRIRVYAISGKLLVTNVFKFIDGIVSSVSIDDSKMTLKVDDKILDFNGRFEYSGGLETFTDDLSGATVIIPQFDGKNIPEIWGMYSPVSCANVKYVAEGASVTDNNKFAICKHYGADVNSGRISMTITNKSGSDVTLSSVKGLNIRDELLTSSMVFCSHITAINRSTNTVTVTEIAEVPAIGQTIYRDRIGRCDSIFLDNGSPIFEMYRNGTGDFSTYSYSPFFDSTNKVLMTDINNTTSNNFQGTNGQRRGIAMRIYGEDLAYTLNGGALYSSDYGVKSKAHQVVYSYLRNKAGFVESDFDVPSLEALDDLEEETYDVGFAVPAIGSSAEVYPTHREIVSKILKSDFLSLFQSPENKIKLSRISKISGDPDHVIDKNEIYSFSYSENFQDISAKVQMRYRLSELVYFQSLTAYGVPPFTNEIIEEEDLGISGLYGSSATTTVDTLLYNDTQAADHALKRFYINAYPFNVFEAELPAYYLDVSIGDVVRLERYNVPGLSVDGKITGRVISTTFNGKSVGISCWTQVGVQNNVSAW